MKIAEPKFRKMPNYARTAGNFLYRSDVQSADGQELAKNLKKGVLRADMPWEKQILLQLKKHTTIISH